MIVLTFFNPFTLTQNSYFATWVALIASLLVLGDTFSRVGDKFRELSSSHLREDAQAKTLLGLFLASVIVACASIEYVGEGYGQATFGLIAGIVTACTAALMHFLHTKQKIGLLLKKAFAITFFLLWVLATGFLTFDAPFLTTSNGFFATWAAMYFITWYAFLAYGGGDFHLTATVRRSLSFHSMEDTRGNRLESVSHSAAPTPPYASSVSPNSNVA